VGFEDECAKCAERLLWEEVEERLIRRSREAKEEEVAIELIWRFPSELTPTSEY